MIDLRFTGPTRSRCAQLFVDPKPAIAELNAAVRAIEVKGQRLPDAILAGTGVEAPPKT